LQDAIVEKSELAPISIRELLSLDDLAEERYRAVTVSGSYLKSGSVFIDNEVLNGKVGYKVLTPFRVSGADKTILVDRGWVPVGASRSELPQIETSVVEQTLAGRLNNPKARPPIWDDEYPVYQGKVWQYLPVEEYVEWSSLEVLPLVFELSPKLAEPNFEIQWQNFADLGVATHKGYAFQWFAMALGFFICCIVVLLRSGRFKRGSE